MRRTDSREIDGRVIQLPMVDVHTVGAGGGSIGWRDAGGALRVGPALGRRRARARPATAAAAPSRRSPTPTCCSATSPPTRRWPAASSSTPRRPRRRSPSSARSLGLDALETAEGIVRVANQEMVRALRVVTVERGVDPRALRAAAVRRRRADARRGDRRPSSGSSRILCPRASGVLSALGLCASERRRDTARTVMLSGRRPDAPSGSPPRSSALRRSARRGARGRRAARSTYELRYRGQAFELPVPGSARARPGDLAERFAAEHERPLRLPRPRRRGRARQHPPGAGRARRRRPSRAAAAAGEPRARAARQARFGGEWVETPVLRGEPRGRARGARARCIFELPEATLVLPARLVGARSTRRGTIVARATETRAEGAASTRSRLQVLIGGLRAACEEMGAALIRSAYSANIKERHDCSTALFDAAGELVMQAEHIPVHLGSMPDAVAAVLDEEQRPGRRLDPQRPLPRRHPPARHHPDLAGLRRRRAARLRRQPRPPRRRRRARRRAACRPSRRGSRRRAS